MTEASKTGLELTYGASRKEASGIFWEDFPRAGQIFNALLEYIQAVLKGGSLIFLGSFWSFLFGSLWKK